MKRRGFVCRRTQRKCHLLRSAFPLLFKEYEIINDWLESDDYENEPDVEWGKIGLDIDSNAGCDIDWKNSENIFFKTDCMQKEHIRYG